MRNGKQKDWFMKHEFSESGPSDGMHFPEDKCATHEK